MFIVCNLEHHNDHYQDYCYSSYIQLSEPADGLKDWLDAVSTARIPCAIVSSLDRRTMVATLERLGLTKYFQVAI